jgi:nucleoside-diphosphate-sugar epimerase
MRQALIGHSGFVGGNLRNQAKFDAVYRSTDIADISGESFDLVVCAGAPGAKYLANQNPQQDVESLDALKDALGGVNANHVVLISTVDVYPQPHDVNEDSAIDAGESSPYGRHRRELEEFVRFGFTSTIIRLPALFGPGLKKNIVYDLLHSNRIEHLHPDSEFQFYDVTRLWGDIERARSLGVPLLNIATEPTSVRDVAAEAFGLDLGKIGTGDPVRYDVHSNHASDLGGPAPYVYGRSDVLPAMRRFVESEGWERP